MTHGTSLVPLLALVPLLGGLGVALLPSDRPATTRLMAMFWSLTTLAIAVIVAYLAHQPEASGTTSTCLDSGSLFFQSRIRWIDMFGLQFAFGLDAISLWLVLLTAGLMPLVILGSFSAVNHRLKEYHLWLLVLEAAMIGTFVATDLIFFYICFEFTLVPLFFLIGIFGSTQRVRAAKVFFLYTFTGSMLTFAGLLYVAWFNASQTGQWDFSIRQLVEAAGAMTLQQQTWVLLALLAGFAVKVPLFPLHTWLPLAHTEAPTGGSVILAGVLLKLGTYGLLRFALPMTPEATVLYAPTIAGFAVVGILYAALICWVQKDVKKLIAYSSVSHLGFCVLGMFALNHIGTSASVVHMINHGLSTGALFLCIGMMYERLHTREMSRMGGLARVMPVWSFFLVFFCLASVGLPGLNGFVGEFLVLLGAFQAKGVLGDAFTAACYAGVAGLGMIFGAIYILYMVGMVVFGPVRLPGDHGVEAVQRLDTTAGHRGVADLNIREIITLVPLAVGCLGLGLYPKPLLDTLEAPVARLIEPAQIVVRGRSDEIAAPADVTRVSVMNPSAHLSGRSGSNSNRFNHPSTAHAHLRETPR